MTPPNAREIADDVVTFVLEHLNERWTPERAGAIVAKIEAGLQAERERCAQIAEAYLHSEPNAGEAVDSLDRVAAYSNGTVRRIAAAIRDGSTTR